MIKHILVLAVSTFFILGNNSISAQISYFPPLNSDEWQTTDANSLGWCTNKEQALDHFLDSTGTKSFIILIDGKIVKESYYNGANATSIWYWASAGKSLTSMLIGMAQEKGLLSIQDKSSDYLGKGWTSATLEQENKITIWNQLTMTTGLEVVGEDEDCTDPSYMAYHSPAGTRWDYYNATYRLLHNVISAASGKTINEFTTKELGEKIGMKGLWSDHIFYSNARAMARYGLLALNNGKWDAVTLLHDMNYLQAMKNTSQNLNKSYGYLWWLNGKESFMLPTSQLVFNKTLIGNAPIDLYCALGKNDQKIYVIPSEKMVIIRMGEDGGQITGALSAYDDKLWQKINDYKCLSTSTCPEISVEQKVFPNPAIDEINIQDVEDGVGYAIFGSSRNLVGVGRIKGSKIDISRLSDGNYYIVLKKDGNKQVFPFVKMSR